MTCLIKKCLFLALICLSLGTIASAATVTVSPAATTITAGATQLFSAGITGGIPYFSWSISCPASSCGSITQGGLYTSPTTVSSSLVVTVTATDYLTYPAGSGSTTVTVNPPGPPVISVTVSPSSATVAPLAQQPFTATVNNSSNQSVMWSVSCATSSCGTISGSGVYTAPSAAPSPNSITVTATSLADTTKSANATVTIGTISVSISPSNNVQVSAGASQPFTATVTGTSNQAVNWSVSGSGCTGSACGSITTGGTYTAPSTLPSPASVTVTAVSQANTSATASVGVTLTPAAGFVISPKTAQVTAGTKLQMSASNNGVSTTSVSWSVSGGGSISSSGLYTAPAASTISSSVNVTVTGSLRTSYGTTATAALTVVPPVVISIWPSTSTVSVNAAQQFIATVTGASNPAVTWSVSGAGCSGAACGTVTSNGSVVTYVGPSLVPSQTAVTLTAALTSNPSQSGTATITVAPTNDGLLSGQYAFLFRGYDASGSYQAAGTFTADGNGNLTNGVEDINCGAGTLDSQCAAGPVIGQTFTGTYTVNADGRGTFSFNGSTFAMGLTPSGAKAHFIESDSSGITGSGILELQTPAAFTNSAFSGAGYAFGLVGLDTAGAPIAEIGGMDLASSSASSTGQVEGTGLDVNDNGQIACYPSETRGLFGCGSAGTTRPSGAFNIGSNGRGTVNLSVPGFGSGTFNFTIYVISSSEFFLFSTDPVSVNPVVSGQGLVQQMVTNSFSYFQKGYAAFDWTGAAGGVNNAAVGRWEFDGSGNLIDFAYDENNGGAITIGAGVGACSKTVGSCTYALEPNGDVYLRFAPAAATSAILLYPTSPNSGFVLGTGSYLFGKSDAQTITVPPSFAFGTDLMVAPGTTVVSGTGSFTGTNQLLGNEDESSSSGFTGGLLWGGTYSPGSLNGGTATMYLTAPTQQTIVFFAVSYQKTVAVDLDSTVTNPSVLILQQ